MKVLLLGGTGEARELAAALVDAGIDVVSSLAGRTTAARLPVGELRVGGFGGVAGLTRWLRENPVEVVVDATHPFAATITEHAVAAAREAGVGHVVLRRPGWSPVLGDDWHWAGSTAEAAEMLPRLGKRAFLTIGRQELDTFAHTGLWMLARCIDPPEPPPGWCTLMLARGPFTLADEESILREHRIDVLVTKDSGGPATAAKLTAARQFAVPVIVVRRPPLPAGAEAVESVADAVRWVMRVSG